MTSPLLDSCTFAVIDFETTGIDARSNRVIEAGVVTIACDGTVLDRWETLIRPDSETKLSAGRLAMLEGAPTFAQVGGDLVSRLTGHVVAGHNVAFDLRFLDAELRRLGARLPALDYVCTRDLVTLLGADVPNRTLAALAVWCGVPFTQWHAALGDAAATADVLAQLLARAQGYGRRALDGVTGRWESPEPHWPQLTLSGLAVARDLTRFPPKGAQPGSKRATTPSFRRLGAGGSPSSGGLQVTITLPDTRTILLRATARKHSDDDIAGWDPLLQDLIRRARHDGDDGDAACAELDEIIRLHGDDEDDDEAGEDPETLWYGGEFRGVEGIATLERIVPAFREQGHEELVEALDTLADLYRRHGGRDTDARALYAEAFTVALTQARADGDWNWLQEAVDHWWSYLAALRDTNALGGLVARCLDDAPDCPWSFKGPVDLVTFQIAESGKAEPLIAEQLAWVAHHAFAERGHPGRWEALAALVRLYEKTDRADEAAALSEKAWADGCDSPALLDRLSLRLERAKDFARAAEVCERALRFVGPNYLFEVLDKRRQRCLTKASRA